MKNLYKNGNNLNGWMDAELWVPTQLMSIPRDIGEYIFQEIEIEYYGEM